MCTCVQQNLFSNFRSFREFLVRSNNCDPFCCYGFLNRVDGKCFYLDLLRSARISISTCLDSVTVLSIFFDNFCCVNGLYLYIVCAIFMQIRTFADVTEER